MKIVLCEESYPGVKVNVTAELIDDKLKISGHDIGKACEDLFGDSDYEYFYSFDTENTCKLFESLSRDQEINKSNLLYQHFNGTDGCRKLREYCEKNEIRYSVFSY